METNSAEAPLKLVLGRLRNRAPRRESSKEGVDEALNDGGASPLQEDLYDGESVTVAPSTPWKVSSPRPKPALN